MPTELIVEGQPIAGASLEVLVPGEPFILSSRVVVVATEARVEVLGGVDPSVVLELQAENIAIFDLLMDFPDYGVPATVVTLDRLEIFWEAPKSVLSPPRIFVDYAVATLSGTIQEEGQDPWPFELRSECAIRCANIDVVFGGDMTQLIPESDSIDGPELGGSITTPSGTRYLIRLGRIGGDFMFLPEPDMSWLALLGLPLLVLAQRMRGA